MNKKSFSYAEAMVTMLIVAIIMVATTPILSQRKNVDQKQLWRLVDGTSSIYFGTGTGQRVIIGQNNQKANEDARLVIVEAAGAGEVNSTKPIMRFYDATYNNEFGRLISNASSVGLGANVLNAAAVTNSVAIGAGALSKVTAGDNTAIGFNACANVTSGAKNICIGANSGPTAEDTSNKLYIGPQTNNHSLIEGDFSGSGRVDIFGQLFITVEGVQKNVLDMITNAAEDITPSDARLKNIGKVSTAGLAEINKIVVKNFTYKNDKNKNPHVGVIAQELQKIFPHSVKKGEDGYLRIKTDEMFYAMLNAIKELDAKFNKNDAKVQKMEQEIENLRKENAILTQKITEIEQTLQKK